MNSVADTVVTTVNAVITFGITKISVFIQVVLPKMIVKSFGAGLVYNRDA